MTLTIEYCVTCNYRPIAAALAFRIVEATGLRPSLVPSNTSGSFEIRLDGELIFSKLQSGMFPDQPTTEKIFRMIREKSV